MNYVITFVTSFIIVFLYYYISSIRKIKKMTLKRLPNEIQLFINMYHVDIEKVGKKKIIWHTTIMYSTLLSIIVVLISLVDKIISKVLLGVGLVFIFIIVGTYLLNIIYKKKGWIKNEKF